MNLQALFDGISAQWQHERAQTQMTLGELISVLEAMDPTDLVANLCRPHSYRGYYDDLAFERDDGMRKADELLAECNAAMGQVFIGYKGGNFVMGKLTPLWVAKYGCCGQRLIAVHAGGELETAEDE